jgi:hypothetical protein
VQQLFPKRPVDVRPEQSAKRKRDLLVFVRAALGAFLGQVPFFDEVAEQLCVCAVGDAEQIVEPLRGCVPCSLANFSNAGGPLSAFASVI